MAKKTGDTVPLLGPVPPRPTRLDYVNAVKGIGEPVTQDSITMEDSMELDELVKKLMLCDITDYFVSNNRLCKWKKVSNTRRKFIVIGNVRAEIHKHLTDSKDYHKGMIDKIDEAIEFVKTGE